MLATKEALKNIVRFVSPRALTLIQSTRLRLGFRRQFGARQQLSEQRIFDGDSRRLILSGPFKGMRYLNETVWGPIEPKWIGCYEEELHEIVDEVIAADYPTIIDVGSAEGYYAVGLAWRCPQTSVFSFDTDIWARLQQRRLARLNGVDNIEIGATCSWADITRLASDRSFLLCDIEGFEYELLDPVACPALERCDMLIEVHSNGALDTQSGSDALTNRFERTHRVTEIRVRTTRATYVSGLLGGRLSKAEIDRFVDENRDRDQVWLWLKATAASRSPSSQARQP
jgi:hypothetical protein